MRCTNSDITARGLDIPRRISHLAVGISRRVFLHPQVISGEDIAALVGDDVGVQRQIIGSVQQRGVDDGTRRAERQGTARAGKTVNGNIAAAGNVDIAAALNGPRTVKRHGTAGKRARSGSGGDLSVIR
ncbi:hypothetical protein D3C72_1672550 [compost metagenome]